MWQTRPVRKGRSWRHFIAFGTGAWCERHDYTAYFELIVTFGETCLILEWCSLESRVYQKKG